MVVLALDFGCDSSLWYHKILLHGCPLTGLHKNLFDSKIALIPVYISWGIVNRKTFGESCR